MSFRLLNSEIGNDRDTLLCQTRLSGSCFRLLNSEIGNDQIVEAFFKQAKKRFRLLNSEIGNDQNAKRRAFKKDLFVFVSLTRR